eukprot:6492726-Amphidinium_carterae.3
MRLAPVCERVIEREHRDIKMENPAPHTGPVLVSLANRLPSLIAAFEEDTRTFKGVVAAFEEVRHARQIPFLIPVLGSHYDAPDTLEPPQSQK